jgi:hypothetical protein
MGPAIMTTIIHNTILHEGSPSPLGVNQERDLSISDSPPLDTAMLTAPCGRLTDHADRIENIIARPLVDALLLASRAIEHCSPESRGAIDNTTNPVCRDHLRKLVGGR